MSVQQTLTGEETDTGRERPETLPYCYECGKFVLRSTWIPEHKEHSLEAEKEQFDDDDEDDDDDEPEEVGGIYTITLSYSVDYRFRIPAWSEHEAERRAKDLKLDAHPADAHHVHTRKSKDATIWADDPKLPDDFDPYDGTPIWEVYGEEDDEERS